MECSVVEMFHWPICQIDETDIESLIPFVFRYPIWKKESRKPREKAVYADQIDL
jgi:hypothetical protein